MKKLISLVLVMCMAFSIFACKKQEVAKQNVETEVSKVEDTQKQQDEGDKIGMLTLNTISEKELKENMRSSFKEQGNTEAKVPSEIRYYDELSQAVLALDRGDVDMLVLPIMTANYIINKNIGKYDSIPIVGCFDEYSMGALEKNKPIIDRIDNVIKELFESGSIVDVIAKNVEINNDSNRSKLPHFDGAETYRVILTGDLPPMDYLDPKGNPAGFNVDLLSLISNKLKLNFEIVNGNAGSRFLLLTSDKADIAFWTYNISRLPNNASKEEIFEIIKKGDRSNFVDLRNDIPKGIVTTRPYTIAEQVLLFSKNSKMAEKFKNLTK